MDPHQKKNVQQPSATSAEKQLLMKSMNTLAIFQTETITNQAKANAALAANVETIAATVEKNATAISLTNQAKTIAALAANDEKNATAILMLTNRQNDMFTIVQANDNRIQQIETKIQQIETKIQQLEKKYASFYQQW